MIFYKKLLLALALVCLGGLSLAPALAAAQAGSGNPTFPSGSGTVSPPTGSGDKSVFGIDNPLGNNSSICTLLKGILNIAFLLGIPVATFFMMYAGFKLVLARGNPEELRKARLNLFYVVVGIAVFLGAWLLAQVIAATIQSLNIDIPGFNNC